jgi:hypothetical protein
MPKRMQITLSNDVAYVLGVAATNDGVPESVIVQKAIEHYLSGRLRYPPIARAARALGSKMPDRVLNNISPSAQRPEAATGSERSRDDRGSLTAFFMIVLLALFSVIGLSVDGGRMLAARGSVAFASSAAANAGALSLGSANTSGAVARAVAENKAVISPSSSPSSYTGPTGSPTDGYCVTAQKTEPTLFLGIVGINTFTARVQSCASTQGH